MHPQNFFEALLTHQITSFSGVPDSTLQPMINYLNTDKKIQDQTTHLQAVNECEAIAYAAGYNLATKKIAMVYLQNSGLGKAVNPLTSLVDKEVYSIPLLLFIGWRGIPEAHDDPQHKKMGRVMLPLLKDLEIPYSILENDGSNFQESLQKALVFMQTNSTPYALICKNGFFAEFVDPSDNSFNTNLSCRQVIDGVMDHTDGNELIIATTGRLSRALDHLRVKRGDAPHDFYTLGSMGCASSIGLGIAQSTKKSVIILDGDGAALMQLGTMASIGHASPKNFYHIIIDNNAYCSTGCQPSISNTVDFAQIAKGCGYKSAFTVNDLNEFNRILPDFLTSEGPALLVTHVHRSRIKYLKRLQDPQLYKSNFQKKLLS